MRYLARSFKFWLNSQQIHLILWTHLWDLLHFQNILCSSLDFLICKELLRTKICPNFVNKFFSNFQIILEFSSPPLKHLKILSTDLLSLFISLQLSWSDLKRIALTFEKDIFVFFSPEISKMWITCPRKKFLYCRRCPLGEEGVVV